MVAHHCRSLSREKTETGSQPTKSAYPGRFRPVCGSCLCLALSPRSSRVGISFCSCLLFCNGFHSSLAHCCFFSTCALYTIFASPKPTIPITAPARLVMPVARSPDINGKSPTSTLSCLPAILVALAHPASLPPSSCLPGCASGPCALLCALCHSCYQRLFRHHPASACTQLAQRQSIPPTRIGLIGLR